MILRSAMLFLACAAAWGSVPPATGQGGGASDPNYSVNGGTAYIVTTRPSSWGSQSGGQWIGPAADAVHQHPAGSGGNFVFTLTFNVTDATKANLTLSVMADPDLNLLLNGVDIYDANQGTITGSPATVNIKGLVKGTNMLTFLVSDFGAGPVGLNAVFSGTLGDGTSNPGCSDPANLLPVTIGQGSGSSSFVDQDGNWVDLSFCIVASSIKDAPEAPPSIPHYAYVANPVAGGWNASLVGTQWVAPQVRQTNSDAPSSCCAGTVTYKAVFNVADTTAVDLHLGLQVDDTVTVTLNGNGLDTSAASYNLADFVQMDTAHGLQNGLNTLIFVVTNTNGPTGLDALIVDFNALPSVPDTSSAPADNGTTASPDPVDSATGQFYEAITDLNLGGIVPLTFSRYYSSALGARSALGAKWMSNFDVRLSVAGTTAKALLFRGKVVTFNKTGGGWQLVSPLNVVYQLVQNGATFQLMDPATRLIYTFAAIGALAKVEDRNGNALTIVSTANGPASVSDGHGRTLTFTYSGSQLTKVADQAGRSVSFAYTGGQLVSFTDAAGNTTKYSYTSLGKLTALMTQKQWPLGNIPATQTYDAQGRVIAQADANGKTLKIGYDGSGGTTITDALANTTSNLADAGGDLKQMSDPNGGTASIAYNGSSQRTSVTDKLGNTTSFTYHSQTGYYASQTDAQGGVTGYTYAPQAQGSFTFYNLTGISYPDGTSASMSYDAQGNLLTSTSTDGKITTRTYDNNGRVTRITGANGLSSTYSYNADGTLASVTDPSGDTKSYTYDSAKRVAGVAWPNGGKTAYVYDANGRLTSVTDPVKAAATAHYDANGQRDSFVNPLGGAWSFAHNGNLQLASATDPKGNKISYSYDDAGRLTSAANAAGEKVSYSFDAANRVASVADNLGTRWSYSYTSEGQIASRTDATGRKTVYSYDSIGRPAGFTSPGGNQYITAHDKMGRVVSQTNPLGETVGYVYDTLGRVLQINRPGSISTAIGRDALGRPVAVTSPTGNTWKFEFDGLGRRTKITDPLGSATSFSYSHGVASGIAYPLGTATFTTDADGRVTKRAYSDGTAINTAYNAMGQIVSADGVSITRNSMGQATSVNGIAIGYDPAGLPAAMTYAQGKTLTYAFDGAGRLASITDWVGGKTTFAYDAAGRLTSLTYPNGIATAYTYDPDGRVIGIAAGSLSSISLTRDAAGKILSAARNLPIAPTLANNTQQYAYDAAAQLTSATYDKMGRVTSQSGRNYNWNLASELVSFSDAVDSATLTYDGLGQVASSASKGVTQTYVINYAIALPTLSIVRQGSGDFRYYVYTLEGALLYSIDAATNARKFYHFDEMGNTAFLTDDSGKVTDSYGITPYGEVADHVGTSDNPFTWQGQTGALQEGRGLYYMRSRHYDATTARFISRDPVISADPRAIEPYSYAGGNPLSYKDPYGSCFLWVFFCSPPADPPAPPAPPPPPPDPPSPPALPPAPYDPGPVQGQLPSAGSTCAKTSSCTPALAGAVTLDPSYLNGSLPPLAVPTGPAAFVMCGGQLYTGLSCLTKGTLVHDVASIGLPGAEVVINGVPGVISNDGGSVVSHDGGTIITQDGAGLLTQDGAGLLTQDGAGLLTQDGGSLIAAGGGNLIAAGAGNLVAAGAGNLIAAGGGN